MNKKLKKYKVGIDSETYAISLVESPAIEEDFVALSKQDEKMEVKLADEEKHIVYGAVLVPDKDIYRNNGEREFYISFTKESIEKMSQDFMREYRQQEITLDHENAANEICVVESWIKADMFKDKSVALGLNEELPVGSWFCGMKVNNIETWERIKSGELNGFSVESMISLEEFAKNDNNMDIETNDMKFWTKLKDILSEVLSSVSLSKQEDEIAPIQEELEENVEPQEPTVEPQEPIVEEPTVEEPVEQPTETPKEEVKPIEEEKPTEEEVKPTEETPKDNHLEELVNSLKEEIEALKKMNNGLSEKVKELSKEPSVNPINVNARNNGGSNDTYRAWREQLQQML